MDSSSFSSPLESPEVPITSSVVTLQSAESFSNRRQVRLSSGHCSETVVHPAHAHSYQPPSLPTQSSLTKTPDTPSANISPSQSPSEHSQAFTSHFTSESSLLRKVTEGRHSPSAILTPSTDFSPETDAQNSDDIDILNFYEEPWDITNFEYDLHILSLNGKSTDTS